MAVGMTDYLTKPYTFTQIYVALAKISSGQLLADQNAAPLLSNAGNQQTVMPAPASIPPETASTAPILDEMFLDEIIEIDDDNGNALVREIITMYLQDSMKYLEDVRACVIQRNAAELATTAHALKSMSVSLGGRALGELCHKLEVAGRTNELGNITHVMARLESHYLKLVGALENYRDKHCVAG
jgi:HPt (histidine-containing phosphotransfer) domain-containing protein